MNLTDLHRRLLAIAATHTVAPATDSGVPQCVEHLRWGIPAPWPCITHTWYLRAAERTRVLIEAGVPADGSGGAR